MKVDPPAPTHCDRCRTRFEPVSWIGRVCPPCEREEARFRFAVIGSLVCAGVLLAPLYFALRAGLSGASPFEAGRIAFYLLGGLVLGVSTAGAALKGRAQRRRRGAAAAADITTAPSPPRAPQGRTLLAVGIVGVSLAGFAVGAEFARHWCAGAGDPLTLAWLTLVEDWEFAGLRVWKWLLGLYLGVVCVGGIVWFQVVERHRLRRHLRATGGDGVGA